MTRTQDRLAAPTPRLQKVVVPIGATDSADFLGTIPALSTCTRAVLEEFVARGIAKVHCAAGKTLTSRAHEDRTLFVLAAGSALLHTGDNIAIALEPGDYFGDGLAGRRQPISSVVAVSDIEVLVISPQDVAWLEQASCRDRHPSRTDWRTTLPSSARPGLRRGHRRLALAR